MSDLIDRQAAIDALRKKQDNGKGDISRFYNTIIQHDIEAIMLLPSAEPKRGKWIKYPSDSELYVCSKCASFGDSEDKFCRFCGAKMEVTT